MNYVKNNSKCCRIRTTISSQSLVFSGAWIRKEVVRNTPCRTHIFLTQFLCVTYRHCVHRWLKVFAVRMLYLSISPSPFSCFIRLLCCSRTVTLTPRSRLHLPCRTVPDPNARVQRTSARAARSLAPWLIPRTPQRHHDLHH